MQPCLFQRLLCLAQPVLLVQQNLQPRLILAAHQPLAKQEWQ